VQFDVIMRKPIFELQACTQCILIASMRRANSPIDLQDVVLLRETTIRRDPIFHGCPINTPQHTLVRVPKALPKGQELRLNLC